MTRIDGVLLPAINRNPGFNNGTALQPPPYHRSDSETESPPVPTTSKK